MNQNKFWQRQKDRIKAWTRCNVLYLSSDHNEEARFLAKPQRVSPEAIISVVVPFVNEVTIPCKARLGYDSLWTYIIHSDSRMLPLGSIAYDQ